MREQFVSFMQIWKDLFHPPHPEFALLLSLCTYQSRTNSPSEIFVCLYLTCTTDVSFYDSKLGAWPNSTTEVHMRHSQNTHTWLWVWICKAWNARRMNQYEFYDCSGVSVYFIAVKCFVHGFDFNAVKRFSTNSLYTWHLSNGISARKKWVIT